MQIYAHYSTITYRVIAAGKAIPSGLHQTTYRYIRTSSRMAINLLKDLSEQMTQVEQKVRVWTPAFIQIFFAVTLIRSVNQMQYVYFPVYLKSIGGSAIIIGLLQTIFSVSNIILRPFAGILIDTKGRYRILTIGAFLLLIGSSGNVFVASILMVLVMRAFSGFGNSLAGTTLSTMASDILPETRLTDGLGFMNLGSTFAQALVPTLILGLDERSGPLPCLILIMICCIITFTFTITQKKHVPKLR